MEDHEESLSTCQLKLKSGANSVISCTVRLEILNV